MQVKKDAQDIYDFDKLVIDPKIARIGGEIVDVSVIPVAVVLAMAQYRDKTKDEILKTATADPDGEMLKLFKLVSDVCIVSNPKITVDFLMEHLNYKKFAVFMKFVLEPMKDAAEDFIEGNEGDEGNETTDETSSD